MKQFFKFMFASMLGFILSMVIFVFIIAAMIGAAISSASSDEAVTIDQESILHISFKLPLQDRSSDNPFENFDVTSFKAASQPGINDIIKTIDKAASDPNIKGIYLDLAGLSGGLASYEEVRNALLGFRDSKKFIYAYSDYYTQGSYYLASVADQIWVNPSGVVDFRGLSVEMPFLKGLLEKLEVEPQIIRHGKFKSAIEPFILDKMSEENRNQVATYVDAFWNHFLTQVSASRKIDVATLDTMADSLWLQTASDALKYKMVDKVGYKDEFLSLLASKTGKSSSEDLKMVALKKYVKAQVKEQKKEFTRDKIAVIFASGDITGGRGDKDQIGSESLAETIRKARLDEKVKAVVLRVNSPGGDALASEVIWRETMLCKKAKPFVISMGDVAASGGYYISCAADTIVAQPNTITGSIGVFGVLFNAQKMFNNKLGVTFDSYETGPFANTGTMTRPLTEAEKTMLQNSVERVYSIFTTRVAEGRQLPLTFVDSIGQGRVWSGVDAFKLGLVDVLGGLDDAIQIAARMAKVTNYRISELPEQKEPFAQFMEDLSGEMETRYLQFKFGDQLETFRYASKLLEYKGVQARLPMVIKVD